MPPLASLTDLAPGQCPLLPGHLVANYNILVNALRTVRANVPRLAAVADTIADDLGKVRIRLMRDHFHVGFLGSTQVGKSTTFNNILGVADDKDRCVSEQGNGSSTTSVITRLHAKSEPADEVELHYTTEQRFLYKRAQMCKAIGLDPEDPKLTDAVILERLPEIEKKVKLGEKDAKTEDPRYLRRLLLSVGASRRLLGSPPQPGEFARRFEYTTHSGPPNQASPYLLLEDVLIRFRTDVIHRDLEMIDLPGLGAHVTMDTIISRERLEELDGALVFVNTMKRDDEVAENVFTGLRKNFSGDFLGRVWLIFTRFDGLGNDFLRGKGDNQENGFDGIAKLATRHGIPPAQIFLVSNALSRNVERVNGRLDPKGAAAVLGFPLGALPTGLDRNADLQPGYQALFDDGGIGRLRELLRQPLVDSVRQRSQDWVAAGLCKAAAALIKELEFDRRRGGEDLLADVEPCLIAVQHQLEQLLGRNTYFDAPAVEARTELQQQFKQRFIPSPINDARPLEAVRERYPFDARALEIALELQFELAVPRVYVGVGAAFHGLPEVPVHGRANVQQAWEQVGEKDAEQPASWRGDHYPVFVVRTLFEGIRDGEAEAFNGALYRRLMEEKIKISVQQAMHVLRWRIIAQLRGLEKDLDGMTRVDPDIGAGSGRLNYDELIANLRKLCP
jgi:hypothetical protein